MVSFLNQNYRVVEKGSFSSQVEIANKQLGRGPDGYLYNFITIRVKEVGLGLISSQEQFWPIGKPELVIRGDKPYKIEERLAVRTGILEIARERFGESRSYHRESQAVDALSSIVDNLDKFSELGEVFSLQLAYDLLISTDGATIFQSKLDRFLALGEVFSLKLVDTLLKSGNYGLLILECNLDKFLDLGESFSFKFVDTLLKSGNYGLLILENNLDKFLDLGEVFSLKLAYDLLISTDRAPIFQRKLDRFLALGESFSFKLVDTLLKSGNYGLLILDCNLDKFIALGKSFSFKLVDTLLNSRNYGLLILEFNLDKFLDFAGDIGSLLIDKLLKSYNGAIVLKNNLEKALPIMTENQKATFIRKMSETTKGRDFAIDFAIDYGRSAEVIQAFQGLFTKAHLK